MRVMSERNGLEMGVRVVGRGMVLGDNGLFYFSPLAIRAGADAVGMDQGEVVALVGALIRKAIVEAERTGGLEGRGRW